MSDLARRKAVLVSGLQIFPPESGGQLRSAHVARKLAAEGYEVLVYSLTGRKADYLRRRPSEKATVAPSVVEHVDRRPLYGALQFLSYRLGLPPFWLGALPARLPPKPLGRALAEADLVVVDQPYLHGLLRRARGKKILNTHNVEFHLHRGSWLGRRAISPLVEKIEREALDRGDEIWCCSDAEREIFERMMTVKRPVVVVPNASVRIERSDAARRRAREALGIPDAAKVVLFSASQYGPNQEALAYLSGFAASHARLLEEADAYLLVVGSVASEPRREGRLIVTGPVPSVDDYFSAADLAINPVTTGSGTSLKMLQYLAAGLPTLSTRFGARALNLREGKDYVPFSREDLVEVLRRELGVTCRESTSR